MSKLQVLYFAVAALVFGAAPIGQASACQGLQVPATVVRVIDGDTVVVNADIWPQITTQAHVRLAGINAPEIHTSNTCEKSKGLTARNWVVERLPAGSRVLLKDIQLGKYAGRVVARVFLKGRAIGPAEVAAGLAHVYDGGARGSFCH